MNRSFGIFVLATLILAGCATVPEKPLKPGEIMSDKEAAKVPRQMIVYVPLTDEEAASWLTLFSRYPRLRMVVAISPRFRQFEKRPELKVQFDALLQAGRIEVALQLPNPPVLPLIIDSNSARESLSSGTSLPTPPFAYPDDIVQMIARAKADFFKTWKTLPKGFIFPYGAASPAAIRQLERLGFAWVVGSIGATDSFGVYRSGPLLVWDAYPHTSQIGTLVRVWDDRAMGDAALGRKTIEGWAKELEARPNVEVLMPSDFTIAAAPMPEPTEWKRRTWSAPDWSGWIGSPAKNAAWVWLRKTREALETFKNSGEASVKRLDMAYEEMFMAESAGYFSTIGNPALPAASIEDREREFKASLSSVYKLIGQNPPDSLFQATAAPSETSGTTASAARVSAEMLADKRERVVIEDPSNDVRLNAGMGFDLRRVEILSGPENVDITATLGAPSHALIDIYIDQNRTPEVGTSSLLPMRSGLNASAEDAWEYALTISSAQATLFRTQAGGTYETAGTFPVTVNGPSFAVSVPRSQLRGNPSRWGYQVLALPETPLAKGLFPIYDLLDPHGSTQTAFFETFEAGVRSDVPFVRVPSKK